MSPTPKYRHGGPVPEDASTGDDPTSDEATDDEATIADQLKAGGSLRERVPIVGGLVAGVGAFLTTFVVLAATTFSVRNTRGTWAETESSPHVVTEASWMHLMNLGAELQLGGEPIETSGLPLYRVIGVTTSPLYTILMFGIIVVAGYAIADCIRTDSPVERLAGTLLIVPGYLTMVVGLAAISTWELPAESDTSSGRSMEAAGQEVSFEIADAALHAGVLVPTVFALLGGALAIGHRRWTANRDPR